MTNKDPPGGVRGSLVAGIVARCLSSYPNRQGRYLVGSHSGPTIIRARLFAQRPRQEAKVTVRVGGAALADDGHLAPGVPAEARKTPSAVPGQPMSSSPAGDTNADGGRILAGPEVIPRPLAWSRTG